MYTHTCACMHACVQHTCFANGQWDVRWGREGEGEGRGVRGIDHKWVAAVVVRTVFSKDTESLFCLQVIHVHVQKRVNSNFKKNPLGLESNRVRGRVD